MGRRIWNIDADGGKVLLIPRASNAGRGFNHLVKSPCNRCCDSVRACGTRRKDARADFRPSRQVGGGLKLVVLAHLGRPSHQRIARGLDRDNGLNRLRLDGATPEFLRQRVSRLASLRTDDATMEIILVRMNATPATGDTRLVSSVIIRVPLKIHRSARSQIDLHGICRRGVMMEAPREGRTAGNGGEHFGCRTTESGVARHIAREGRSVERLALEGHPILGQHPAIGGLTSSNGRSGSVLVILTRPGIHCHLAHVERTRIVALGVHVPDELVLAP